MENSSKRGVFSPSTTLDSTSMINCLQALIDSYPSMKFTSVRYDEKLQGFRVLFSEPDETVVLEKNQVTKDDQIIWIYPLTTYLTVLNISQNKTLLFERDLRDAINKKFGKPLTIRKINGSLKYKDWLVEIDVPEFKELEVFQCESFNDMTISLPNRNETLTVAFWCRHCKLKGHFQHECVERVQPRTSTESQIYSDGRRTDKRASESQPSATNLQTSSGARSPVGNAESPSKGYTNFPFESTESYAEKIGREEIMRAGILSDENKNTEGSKRSESVADAVGTTSNSFLKDKDIKKEVEEREIGTDVKEEKFSQDRIPENGNNPGNAVAPKVPRRLFPASEIDSNHSSGIDSNDDEIQILDHLNKTGPSNASNFAKNDESAYSEEVSRSPTGSRNGDYTFSSVFSTPGPSQTPSATRPTRGAEVTTALSERLQDCINTVCDTTKVLDRKKLDAFLIHVKKKSNPIRVALNYTSNAKGLKQQLQNILQIYYNTPQTGTKEDIQFIKWLNGLVERFDGTIPRKRKRAGRSDEEPPIKK